MPATTILLVRHAAPEPPGPGTEPAADNARSLTAEGLVAAQALAERLRDEPVGAVFSSPYRRALETVEPIATAHGLGVRLLGDLRERRLAGTTLSTEMFHEALRRSRQDATFALPGGESTAEVLDRALRALEFVRAQTPSGTAVVGTHGGLISILRWHVGVDFTVDDALAEPMPAVYTFAPSDFARP